METELRLREDELVENPTPRVAVCLCLDTSNSMAGMPIESLNEGVRQFFEEVSGDEIARCSAEVAVVTFGGSAQRHLDFGSIENQPVPSFQADGGTPMGTGVNLALDLLEARKREYSSAGIDYFQPWLVLITDGEPTESPDVVDAAAARTAQLVQGRKLTVFPIFVGQGAGMEQLAEFSPTRQPLRLQGLRFKELFAWLSRSVAQVSQSIPGQNVPLDTQGMKGWATV